MTEDIRWQQRFYPAFVALAATFSQLQDQQPMTADKMKNAAFQDGKTS